MSFFKDFKEDFSQAVNELVPGEEISEEKKKEQSDLVVNTLEQEVDVKSELQKLEGMFEKVEIPKEIPKEVMTEEPVNETVLTETILEAEELIAEEDPKQEEAIVSAEEVKKMPSEITIITEGTSLIGNMESTGSFELRGKIQGNVRCNGKMTVTGEIKGNSDTAEFFADAAKVAGEINTTGTVKIGLGSVVIGNITASSAVIAGAIKGDIDVQGPVIVDTSAVVMGNIKSRSVQINNGAVIEGFCSQCYADVDVNSLFGEEEA
ncbi:MAG: polymer-forming cytoskeletal protein [Lachnospiraceae bacterium]